MGVYDLEWYKNQWGRSGKEIYEKAVEGEPGTTLFDKLRLLAEIRSADRTVELTGSVKKATWALVFVGIAQVLVAAVALFK